MTFHSRSSIVGLRRLPYCTTPIHVPSKQQRNSDKSVPISSSSVETKSLKLSAMSLTGTKANA